MVRLLSFRTSASFVTANVDGSLTKFDNDKLVKRIKLLGAYPLLRLINEEIVTAAKDGKVTVLTQELEVVKTFDDPGEYPMDANIRTLAANEAYIAIGDSAGTVRFYNRTGDTKPKVS